jgi:hypothetical protein
VDAMCFVDATEHCLESVLAAVHFRFAVERNYKSKKKGLIKRIFYAIEKISLQRVSNHTYLKDNIVGCP